jgi:transcriptional regulator with XRE-family HTH domain
MKGELYPFKDSISTVLFLLLCLRELHTCPLRTETESSPALRKGQEMYFNQVEFGKRIKEERNRLQMTQEDLAQELNIGYVHMNGIENGRKGCSIDLLLEIAEVLDVSTDYLLTGRLSGGTNTAKNKLKEIAARLNEIVGQLDA